MNWAPYAAYNPQLWHWPETWPLVSVSPTVEPFVVIGYALFYLAPFFPAIWILRRMQRRRPVDSFVWRHPLISLAILIYLVGFVYDAVQEIILIRTQMYIYTQVIPFGSVFAGKVYQFPLLWESSLVTAVMIPAGVLLYRDDTGRTVAEKLAPESASSRVDRLSGRSPSCSSSSMPATCSCTGAPLPSSGRAGRPRQWPARGPTRRRRSTTHRATTRRRASPVRTPPASWTAGRQASPDGRT